MRKIAVLWVLGFFLASASWAHADREDIFPSHEFKAGLQTMYMYYEEPGFMREKGFLHGIHASWTYYFSRARLMLQVEIEGLVGELRYEGQYSDGTPLRCDTEDAYSELRATFGKGFLAGDTGITPYLGLAGRYWSNEIDARGGYLREISQVYMPLGVRTKTVFSGDWTLGLTLEGDVFLGGQVNSYLSDAGPYYSDAENTQDFMDGWGVRASLSVEKKIKRIALGIEPYFRYWRINESDTDLVRYGLDNTYRQQFAYVVEPENRFTMGGMKIYVKF